MAKEKILLIEPDKEMKELFVSWLKEQGYQASSTDDIKEVRSSLLREEFDILIIDIDPPTKETGFFEITEEMLKLCQTLKNDARFSELPIAILTYKKEANKIARAVEAGADTFLLKPFEADYLLQRMSTIFKEIELKKKGKKLLDLNCINYLIKLASEFSREDFFVLAPAVFNKLIIKEVKSIIGEPTLALMIKRVQELIGEDYGFMKETKFLGDQLLMDGVDKASKDIPVEKLTTAFRDYVYAFLHLVQTLTSDILMERGKL